MFCHTTRIFQSPSPKAPSKTARNQQIHILAFCGLWVFFVNLGAFVIVLCVCVFKGKPITHLVRVAGLPHINVEISWINEHNWYLLCTFNLARTPLAHLFAKSMQVDHHRNCTGWEITKEQFDKPQPTLAADKIKKKSQHACVCIWFTLWTKTRKFKNFS